MIDINLWKFLSIRYDLSKGQIETLRDTGMQWKQIAKTLNISERTLQRHRARLGISSDYTDIDDVMLQEHISNILQLTPGAGETYVIGALRGKILPRYPLLGLKGG